MVHIELTRLNSGADGRRRSRVRARLIALLRLTLAALFLIQAPLIQAQQTNERWTRFSDSVFQHYTQDMGLPQPIVTALAEDGAGFLWVGTQGGLSRWDGYRFRNYLPNMKIPGSLPDNYINVLHTDPAGNLWVGTSTGGLVRYDARTDRFVKLDGLSSADVVSLADDGHGGLWIGTDAGLNHMGATTAKVQVMHHSAVDAGSLPDDQVLSVICDQHGAVWVGTSTVLARLDPASRKFNVVPLFSGTATVSNIRSLLEDRNGRIWIGSNHNGAFVIDSAGGKPQQVEETVTKNSTFTSDFVISISEAGSGEIWLGTYGDGIVVVNPVTRQTTHIRHDLKVFTSLLHDQVWAMYFDRTGSMLIGNTGGLDRLVNADQAILSLFGDSSRADGLAGNDIVSVFESANGLIWLGYSGLGVDVIAPGGERIATLRPDQNKPDSALSKGPVTAFASDGDHVYIGTDRGVYRTDMSGQGLKRLEIGKSQPVVNANSLLYDAGILWIGAGRQTLRAISLNGAPLPAVSQFDGRQLTDPRVNVMLRGANNDLWAGTSNGLSRIDVLTGAVEKITFDPADPNGISAGFVSSLLIDQRGRLWVALFGNGINIMTGRDSNGRPRFKKLSTDDGLPNNNVDALLADNQGKIWASTDDGIGAIDPQTLTIHAYHRADGVAIPTYWVNSGAKTAAGELLFGGNSGLTIVRPEMVKEWSYHPPVVVTSALVGGKPLPFSGAGRSQTLVLTPDANSVAIEFSALDYTGPERNKYAYRLDGFDSNWIDTDYTRRLASYTNLPPGNYTLMVRGSNRNGQWTEKSLNIAVHVLPAWYQTWAFRLSLAVALIGLVALLIQARTAYLRKATLELEELVAIRTRELSNSTEQLRQSKIQLEEIAFLDALTGLPNRRLFSERFENFKATSDRANRKFALLLIDLDKFKFINDTYGHDAGDAVLVATAERLMKSTRAVDVVARLGGDEFAVLLDGSEPMTSITAVCERMMMLSADPIVFGRHQFIVSLSIGGAIFGEHGNFQAELYKSADMALYEAKGSGRNTWRCYGSQ